MSCRVCDVRVVRVQGSSTLFFFFNDTATTEIYTLSLHDALPIYRPRGGSPCRHRSLGPRDRPRARRTCAAAGGAPRRDRKSTRLNSSHSQISYAVFCLKKKKNSKSARISYRLHLALTLPVLPRVA